MTKRNETNNTTKTKKSKGPTNITIDREVDGFIRATAASYRSNFQDVLNLVLRAGMRTLLNQMVTEEELDELKKKQTILVDPTGNKVQSSLINPNNGLPL